MKKTIAYLFVILSFSECILFDTINITLPWDGVVKGDIAKDQIFTNALLGAVAEVDRNFDDDVLAIITGALLEIKDDRYYLKEDIDKCSNDALLINLIDLDIGGFTCNARERKIILEPFY